MGKKGGQLKALLEKAQPGWAYQVIALEIEMEDGSCGLKMESTAQLMQLYMLAVEVLESKSDPRYKHFQVKIQNLVKKKIILEEMQRDAARKMEPELLLEARRAELGEKKQDHNLQMYLNSEQVNRRKVKELVDMAEHQSNKISTQVRGNISSQDKNLQDRIQRRKMRSEAGSLQKFKVSKGQVLEKNIAGQRLDAFFHPFQPLDLKKIEIKTPKKQLKPEQSRSRDHLT